MDSIRQAPRHQGGDYELRSTITGISYLIMARTKDVGALARWCHVSPAPYPNQDETIRDGTGRAKTMQAFCMSLARIIDYFLRLTNTFACAQINTHFLCFCLLCTLPPSSKIVLSISPTVWTAPCQSGPYEH